MCSHLQVERGNKDYVIDTASEQEQRGKGLDGAQTQTRRKEGNVMVCTGSLEEKDRDRTVWEGGMERKYRGRMKCAGRMEGKGGYMMLYAVDQKESQDYHGGHRQNRGKIWEYYGVYKQNGAQIWRSDSVCRQNVKKYKDRKGTGRMKGKDGIDCLGIQENSIGTFKYQHSVT